MKTLVEIRLKGFLNSLFTRINYGKKMKGITKIAIIFLAIYLLAAVGISVGGMFYFMGEMLIALNYEWMYFSLMALLSVMIGIVASIFTSSGMLFDAKDNELLLSMPIQPKNILLSRLLTLLILEYIYTFIITIPIVVVYMMLATLSVVQWIFLIIGVLLYPLLSLTIASLLGGLLAYISSKIRFKVLIQTVLLFAFFGGYMYFVMTIQDYMMVLLQQGESIAKTLSTVLPPMYYFGMAIAQENVLYFLYFVLMCLVPSFIAYWILKINYSKILMANKGSQKVVYKKKSLQTSSVSFALLKRELKRFLSMPMYMFNSGLSVVFHILIGGAIFFKGKDLFIQLLSLPELSSYINIGIIASMTFIAIMNTMTSCSLSLEGENLWILKSSPISELDVFHSKIFSSFMVSLVGIIPGGILVRLSVDMTILETLGLFVLPSLASLLVAIIGLIWNLWLPNLTWTNATLVIKQSGSVLGGMLSGMAIVAFPIMMYMLSNLKEMIPLNTYCWMCLAYLALLSMISYGYLITKGVEKYKKI